MILIAVLVVLVALVPVAGTTAMATTVDHGCHGMSDDMSMPKPADCDDVRHQSPCSMTGSCVSLSCTAVIAVPTTAVPVMTRMAPPQRPASATLPPEHVIRPPIEPPRAAI